MLFKSSPLVELEKAVVIYTMMKHGSTFYVGMCDLRDFSRLVDARRNEYFRNNVDELTKDSFISIIAVETNHTAAEKIHAGLVESQKPTIEYLPVSRKHNIRKGYNHRPIEDIETGQRYVNANEACRVHEIDVGAMSRHLRGVGHTVKGMRFRYVE